MNEKIAQNFKYPVIRTTDFCFGDANITGTVLRPDGDWRDYLPPAEEQRRNGVESSSCFVEAQQHTIATILEEQFNVKDQNFAARYNLALLNERGQASDNGGSPIDAGDSFRHEGLVPDELLPFSSDISSWSDFASFKDGNEPVLVKTGQSWLRSWTPQYDIVFTRDEPVETKYQKLREALKYSPVPMSVYAWTQDASGLYVKPDGEQDCHLVECVFLDENNSAYVFDTYPPFVKKLAPLFNSEFAMRWTVGQTVKKNEENWLLDLIYGILQLIKDIFNRQ